MKKIYSIPMLIAATAMAFSSCTEKEKEEPVDTTPTPVFIEVKIVDELNTKATVATKDDELFTAAWEDGDEITITYSGAEEGTATATYNAEEDVFEFEVPANVATKKGDWSYTVEYGITGNTRSQEAGEMNGKYDLMSGTATATDAVFARVDNDVLSVEVKRQTALLYFHITALRSAITETVTAATLKATNSNGTTEIALAVNNGPVMNNEDGMVFWFNVPAGEYSALDLEIETPTYVFETTTKVELPATLVAGTLTKTTGAASGNYTMKGGVPALESDQFDCCDYSPYVWGFNVNNNPTIDTVNMKEGTGCYNFNVTSNATGMIGPIYFQKLADAENFVLPANTSENNIEFSFWLYTDKKIDLSNGAYLNIELTSSRGADKEEIQWVYKKDLNEGWNKIELKGHERWFQDASCALPKFNEGLNFFRMFVVDSPANTDYNIKIDDLRIAKGSANIISQWNANGVTVQINDSHPVFSADKKHIYISESCGNLISIEVATGHVEWAVRPGNRNGKGPVGVNPVNGDIYYTDGGKTYAIKSTGEERWHIDYPAVGCGYVLNSDASVVFILTSSSIKYDNRGLEAVDTTTGQILSSDLGGATIGTDGVTSVNTYSAFSEAVMINDETILLLGAEFFQVIKWKDNKLTRTGEKVFRFGTQVGKGSDIGGGVVVTSDKKTAIFSDQNGWAMIYDLEKSERKGFVNLGNGYTCGMTLGSDNSLYVASRYANSIPGTVMKFNVADVLAGQIGADATVPAVTPVWTAESPALAYGTSDACKKPFDFQTPQVTAKGNVYFSCGPDTFINANQTDQSAIYCVTAGTTGTFTPKAWYPCPQVSNAMRGGFAMTDGYILVATKGHILSNNSYDTPARVYIVPVDETIAPNTWGYYGGDPCATRNVKWVYGSY